MQRLTALFALVLFLGACQTVPDAPVVEPEPVFKLHCDDAAVGDVPLCHPVPLDARDDGKIWV
jgi:hypothetical protein